MPTRQRSALSALAAALLYAVASELVLHSRYAVTDACLVGLTAWTLAFAGRYLASHHLAWGIACALAAGVTCAFKIPGIVTALIPAFAALILYIRGWRLGVSKREHAILIVGIVPLILGIYLLLNPHVVDRSGDAFRDLLGRYRQTRDGGFSSVYLRRPGIAHLMSAIGGIVSQFPSRNVPVSLAISAIATGGIVSGIRRRDALVIVSAAYAACLVLSVAIPNRTFLYRNYIVIVPVISLGFGLGIVSLTEAVRARLQVSRRVETAVVSLIGAGMAGVVGLSLFDAVQAQRLHKDARASAIDWIADQNSGGPPVDVALTPSVLGRLVLGNYPELRDAMQRPSIRFLAPETESCPSPVDGPRYVIDASYRDTHKAPPDDPWQEVWFFRECDGYEQAATFESNPYEANLRAYPTWIGRGSAIVLRRKESGAKP